MSDLLAKAAVTSIIADLSDRRGLSDVWDSIDKEIQQEIAEQWCELVAKATSAVGVQRQLGAALRECDTLRARIERATSEERVERARFLIVNHVIDHECVRAAIAAALEPDSEL